MIVTCSDNNKVVRLWDAATSKPIGESFPFGGPPLRKAYVPGASFSGRSLR
jgi:hypothetical protein